MVSAIGLLAGFAAGAGALDDDRLIRFLEDNGDAQLEHDDRTGLLLHGIRLILAYYRDLEGLAGNRFRRRLPTAASDADETRRISRRTEEPKAPEREGRAPTRVARGHGRSSEIADASRHSPLPRPIEGLRDLRHQTRKAVEPRFGSDARSRPGSMAPDPLPNTPPASIRPVRRPLDYRETSRRDRHTRQLPSDALGQTRR